MVYFEPRTFFDSRPMIIVPKCLFSRDPWPYLPELMILRGCPACVGSVFCSPLTMCHAFWLQKKKEQSRAEDLRIRRDVGSRERVGANRIGRNANRWPVFPLIDEVCFSVRARRSTAQSASGRREEVRIKESALGGLPE